MPDEQDIHSPKQDLPSVPAILLPKIRSAISLRGCVYLGGSGFDIREGETLALNFVDDGLLLERGDEHFRIAYPQLVEIQISGPGRVATGGGFIGGGFGVLGALEGIALAGVLNALTTKESIHTFVSLETHFGEVHVHYSGMEPGAVRIALSPVYVRLRRTDPTWMESQFSKLQWGVDRQMLTTDKGEAFARALANGGELRGAARSARAELSAEEFGLPPVIKSDAEIVSECEAKLHSAGYRLIRTSPGTWQIQRGTGTSYAHSVEDLRRRTLQLLATSAKQ